MDRLRQWVVLTVVAVLAVLAAGWFLLISPVRAQVADLGAQTQEQHQAGDALRTQLDVLRAQAAQLPAEQAKLAAVRTKIPDGLQMPALLATLTATAGSAGVDLVSVVPGAVTPVVAPVTAGATVRLPSAGSTPAAGLSSATVATTVVGSYAQVEQFLDGLEQLPRAYKVTAVTLAPGADPVKPASDPTLADSGRSLSAVVNGLVYLDPARQEPAGTTPATTPIGTTPAGTTPATTPAGTTPAGTTPAGTAGTPTPTTSASPR